MNAIMKIIDFLTQFRSLILFGVGVILIAFTPLPIAQTASKTVTIPIEAKDYSFIPGVIKVNQGDQVVIEFTSADVVHGLYLDGYGISLVSDPGQTSTLSFVADRTGSFRIRCSVTCGALHPFMVGKLKVGANDLVWRGTALALMMGVFGIWKVQND